MTDFWTLVLSRSWLRAQRLAESEHGAVGGVVGSGRSGKIKTRKSAPYSAHHWSFSGNSTSDQPVTATETRP